MKPDVQREVWTRITLTASVPSRQGRAVKVAGREIAIFNLDGRFLTIENACPHRGGPLCDGIVSGSTVVCPLHGQRFDLETGMPVLAAQDACVTTYPTKVEDGIVLVNLAQASQATEEKADAV